MLYRREPMAGMETLVSVFYLTSKSSAYMIVPKNQKKPTLSAQLDWNI